MVNYIYKGYGVTDENGVAHLDHDASGNPLSHSYTGVGAGEIDVVASLDNPIVDGSIVSETYSIWDTLFYDSGLNDGTKNPNWTSSGNPTITPTANGTIVENTTSSIYQSTQSISGDFEAIVELTNIQTNIRVGAYGSSTYCRAIIYNTGFVKIRRENNVVKMYHSTDGETYTEVTYDLNTLTSEDCKFTFYIYSTGAQCSGTYKNLKIYSI